MEKTFNSKVLENHFLNSQSNDYENIDGTWMPKIYISLKDIVHNLEVYDDDVWVCTIPKSGTTWMQELVWLLGNNLDYEGAKVNIFKRFPYLEFACTYVKDMKRPRYIKSHLPWKLLPKQIQSGEKKPKIIYVSRNPKDVIVSAYYHIKLYGKSITLSEITQQFIEGKQPYTPYWNHVLGFHNNKSDNIIHIKYEDMIADLESVVLKVAKLLGKKIDNVDLKKLVHHLSFNQMKNNLAVNRESLIEKFQSVDKNIGNGSFIRQGKSGSYKEEMNSEQIQTFDKWIYENIKDTDYVL